MGRIAFALASFVEGFRWLARGVHHYAVHFFGHLVSSVISVAIVIAIFKQFEPVQFDLGPYRSVVFFALKLLLAVLILIAIIYLCYFFLKWNLVRFDDIEVWASFVPILNLVSRFRRTDFDRAQIRRIMELFRLPNGSPYYEMITNKYSNSTLEANENPTIVLKLPVRNHLSIVDFYDLRLLRHVITSGGRVIIILHDVAHNIDPKRMERAVNKTRHFICRVLGSAPDVMTLSEVLKGKEQGFVRFVLDDYIPHYAKKVSDTQIEQSPESGWISYFAFALFLKTLSGILKPDIPIVVMQWRGAVKHWTDFDEIVTKCQLRVVGLIVGNDFPSYLGNKLATSKGEFDADDKSFHMTDRFTDVKDNIMATKYDQSWIISDTYLNYLSSSLFGDSVSIVSKTTGTSEVVRHEFIRRFRRTNKWLKWSEPKGS